MDQDITFTMELDGQRTTCTVLFTFFSELTNANYMLYTPNDPTQGDEIQLMAARYDPQNLSKLEPLHDDQDRAIVQSFIDYVSSHSADEIEQDCQAAAERTDDGIRDITDL